MNTAAIVETLAKEFSIERENAQRVFDLLSAGYKPPFLARYRRAEIGSCYESSVRRFAKRMKQLEELERRRGTLLRSIEEQKKALVNDGADANSDRTQQALEACMDRFELEDLFLPHRRPEPEVQLALDRGLGALADLLAAPVAEDAPGEAEGSPPAIEVDADPLVAADAPAVDAVPADGPGSEAHVSAARVEFSAELARTCAPFVNPDRGVHTDIQALEGAMRILSDRLGRSPSLRGVLRRVMRKSGRLSARPLVDEKKLGPFRALLKLDLPLRQVQGHRLLALRQAQAARLVAPTITLDEALVLPRVRAALGRRVRPEFASVLQTVAEQALRQRLLPMIEDDVRNELRERAEEEAIRFLGQHLRQILLAPAAGPRPVAGIHVDPKGDWLIVVVDRDGKPLGSEIKVEVGAKEAPEIAPSLGAALLSSGVRDLAVGHGKASRDAVLKLRETLGGLGSDACVFVVHEGGLSSYANSELARAELPNWSVPAREAISLARRHQDPLQELLKTDVRHLGLGREQSIVSKASLRRVLHDTLESSVAHVGFDLNTAPLNTLRHVPGLSFDLAKRLVERRAERPYSSREELRTEGLLDDVSWTNAIGFLRLRDAREPLDRTALHPEQYDLVRRVILEGGMSVEEALGTRDAAKGLKRPESGVDDVTWRDILREISHPGRDPRPRVYLPRLLPPDTDPKTLAKDQVVEGIVWNVTSFGAFVDLGIARDGMIHISEISDHYVRDARALLSVGQIVRGRVLDSLGPRVELSLKNVPEWRRTVQMDGGDRPRPKRSGRRERPRRGEAPEGEAQWSEAPPVLRAARSRRDGMVTGKGERSKRGPKGGGRERSDRRGDRDDHYDPEAIREAGRVAGTYNPFASFFQTKQAPEQKESSPE